METIQIDEVTESVCFNLAWETSKLSLCLKKKVGAVLYDPLSGKEVGVGYGGAVVPCEHCVRKEYEWQQDGCWSIHSEMRAIFDAMSQPTINMHGVGGSPIFRKSFKNHVMFVTHGPCDACIKLCHLFGIPLIIYDKDYHNDYSKWDGKIKIQKKGELHEFDIS